MQTKFIQDLLEAVSPTFGGEKFLIEIPELSVDERERERLAFRNESTLYKRKCDLSGKNIVATFHEDVKWPVYSQEAYWGDGWNALDFGRDYDFSRSFFEQFKDLSDSVPRLALVNKQSENSEYCNFSFANKNCYLTFGSHYEEDCLYGRYSTKNKDLMDFFFMYGSELCYQSIFSSNCYKCIHIERSEQCNECLFCYDLKDCRDCLFSSNLRNKQYYIFNEPHTKEEYFEYLGKLKLSSRDQWGKLREGWLKYRKENAIFRDTSQVNCENCEGSDHQNSKNLKYCFASSDCEDCAYGFQMDQTFSSIDNSHMGYDKCEICYNTIGSNGLFNGICCDSCWHSSNILYSSQCFSSKDCFGCIGMRQAQYCILNKQYSREEYESLAAKIIEHMRKTGEWGQFFPHFLRPYAYNESVAQEFYPMTKEEVLEKGWQWRDKIDQDEPDAKFDIPDDINDVDDSILDKILRCEKSGRPYKIVKKELDFYRKMNLPIPNLCPAERFAERMELKNPYRLYDRQCSKCGIDIQSDIGSELIQKVYCEKCYLNFVY